MKTIKKAILGTFMIGILYLCLASLSVVSAEQTGREKADALLKQASELLDEGSYDRALEAAREAVKADAAYPEAFDVLGQAFLKKGQLDEAVNAYNSALKINPRLRSAKTGIGLALLKKGDVKGAEAILKEALMLNPYPSMTHYALGLVYEKQNDYEKAVAQFREGIQKYKSGKK